MGAFKKMVTSIFRRPAQNWNVEHRAQNLLSKHEKGQKPTMAPKHPSTAREMDQFSRENPDLLKAQKEKNTSLHQMLEGMIVNPDKTGEIRPTNRPLPEFRGVAADDEYGFMEPNTVTAGRCSIRIALEFITDHHKDPQTHSAQAIATEHKLDIEQVKNVLTHFQTLQMQFPKDSAAAQLLEEGDIGDITPSATQKTVSSGKSDSSATEKTPGSAS